MYEHTKKKKMKTAKYAQNNFLLCLPHKIINNFFLQVQRNSNSPLLLYLSDKFSRQLHYPFLTEYSDLFESNVLCCEENLTVCTSAPLTTRITTIQNIENYKRAPEKQKKKKKIRKKWKTEANTIFC